MEGMEGIKTFRLFGSRSLVVWQMMGKLGETEQDWAILDIYSLSDFNSISTASRISQQIYAKYTVQE
jgi:hypothetical protein